LGHALPDAPPALPAAALLPDSHVHSWIRDCDTPSLPADEDAAQGRGDGMKLNR